MSMKQNVPAADCVPKNVLRKTFLMNLTSDLTTAAPYIFRLRRQYRKKRRLILITAQCLKQANAGVCSKLCTAGAIDYKQKDQIIEEKYGAIIVATGFEPIKVDKYDEFAYSQSKDVVTSLELERLMNAAGPTKGTLLRPSDGTHPHTIVFVQCVGSRCEDERGKPYCSKVCCMYTAKHAMLIREKYPDTEVYVFYIDVRTPGKNFDEFYRRAVEQYGVHYIKGMVGKVMPRADGKLEVRASDLLLGKQLHIDADMVVLAAAIEPDKTARPLATMLTASMDTNDFFTEAHPKLRPGRKSHSRNIPFRNVPGT